WQLPPIHPLTLRDLAYEPFAAILRANMRHAGALRIDHVMGLLHLSGYCRWHASGRRLRQVSLRRPTGRPGAGKPSPQVPCRWRGSRNRSRRLPRADGKSQSSLLSGSLFRKSRRPLQTAARIPGLVTRVYLDPRFGDAVGILARCRYRSEARVEPISFGAGR
ncbi:MAG: hypothetical protein HC834_00990, partial [Rhodospirillales bacterium]|nr:hypothetical protein [Rhodospirillales bacterium]